MSKQFKQTAYSEKLRDPRWQKLRLEIMQRDDWTCQICGDKDTTLNVHHRWYERGQEPWDASRDALVTLCESCHENEGSNRPKDEAELLAILKRRFFAHELFQIGKIFDHMPLIHVGEVQLSAVAWFLSHRENLDSLMEAFFAAKCPLPGELVRGKREDF